MTTLTGVLAPEAWWAAAIVASFAGALALVARSGLDPRAGFIAGVSALGLGLMAGTMWEIVFDGASVRGTGLGGVLASEKSVMGLGIGALAGALGALRLQGQPVLRHLDAATPAALIGYATARVGCLLAGCCFGTPTHLPWAMTYLPGSAAFHAHIGAGWIGSTAPHSLAVHPVPIYHASLALVLAVVAWRARRIPGRALAVGLAGYGTGRFLLEFVRGDAVAIAWGLSPAHFAAAALAMMGLALMSTTGRGRRTPSGLPLGTAG